MGSGVTARDVPPDLSVIIVSYNSEGYIRRCVQDVVAAAEGVRFEVILIDNASKDETIGVATKEFGNARWFSVVDNDENLGFGKGCNIGAERARGQYLLFLNPDVFLLPGALRASLDGFAEQDRCGAVMARTFWDDEMEFQFSFLKSASPLAVLVQETALRRLFGASVFGKFWKMDWAVWASEAPVEVLGVPGGYLMMPRALFGGLGGFDERFFMYYEDNDLCLRIMKAQHKIYVLPRAKAIHYCGQSLKNYEGAGMRRTQRKSLISLYVKHYPVLGRLLSVLISASDIVTSVAKRGLGLFSRESPSRGIPVGSLEGIQLDWKSVPGAEYYFIEVSQDPCFLHKVGARVTRNSYFLAHRAYQMLTPDTYFWRAVPMDGLQRVGSIHVGRFKVVRREKAGGP